MNIKHCLKFLNKEAKKILKKDMRYLALKWLDEKWPVDKQICDICGSTQWTIGEEMVTTIVVSKAKIINLNGNTYPNFVIICNNCGNTKYFNAVIAKLIGNK